MDPERRTAIAQDIRFLLANIEPKRLQPPYNMLFLMYQAQQRGKCRDVTIDEVQEVVWGPVQAALAAGSAA